MDSKKSGAGEEEVYTPKLWYFDLMLFTTDQEIPRQSVSSLTDLQMQDFFLLGAIMSLSIVIYCEEKEN